jgi:DNA-binding XRE family transcriptional regulator
LAIVKLLLERVWSRPARRTAAAALPCCHVTLKASRRLPPAYLRSLNTLEDHLRQWRLDLGLLQREVAEQLGVDEASITNWETDKTTPNLHIYPRIIEFLGQSHFPKAQSLVTGFCSTEELTGCGKTNDKRGNKSPRTPRVGFRGAMLRAPPASVRRGPPRRRLWFSRRYSRRENSRAKEAQGFAGDSRIGSWSRLAHRMADHDRPIPIPLYRVHGATLPAGALGALAPSQTKGRGKAPTNPRPFVFPRPAKGLAREHLAWQLGVDTGTLGPWERGQELRNAKPRRRVESIVQRNTP